MYWIKRCYFDGVGHPESFYRDLTFELFPGHWTPAADTVPHCYIDLVNGGGKTTWISLLLTLFEPKRDRFIQCVAGRKKGKDYHYNHYFHRQLSTILVEMVDDQHRQVVLGQYHQKQGDETDRVFFICEQSAMDGASVFEHIPTAGRARQHPDMAPHTESLAAARKWLNRQKVANPRHWRPYKVRKEWHDALREIGINLQTINTLITINSEEGGVSHFARYKSEYDFLQKFFACCFSAREIATLAETCEQDITQGQRLRQLEERDQLYRTLNHHWAAFQPLAERVRTGRDALGHIELDLAEQLRDLRAFQQQLKQAIRCSDGQIATLALSVDKKQQAQRTAAAEQAAVEYQVRVQEYNEVKAAIERTTSQLSACNDERVILQAIAEYRRWQQSLTRCKQHRATVAAIDADQQSPLLKALADARGRAHAVYTREISTLARQRQACKTAIERQQGEERANDQALQQITNDIATCAARRDQCKETVAAADAECQTLRDQHWIMPGESPEVACQRQRAEQQRAASAHESAQNQLERSTERYETAKQMQAEAGETLRQQENNRNQHASAVQQANHQLEKMQQRLQPIDHQLDPLTGPSVATTLERYKQERRARRDHERAQNEQYRHELAALKAAGHLLVDGVTRKALQCFYDRGLRPDQILAYPDYLSHVLDDNATRIARVIDQDPGRYLGLAVTDSDALLKVEQALTQIEWADRPIPIHALAASDLDGTAATATVLASENKLLYSEAACAQRMKVLEEQLTASDKRLNTLETGVTEIAMALGQWHEYWQDTGSRWPTLHEQLSQANDQLAQAKQRDIQACEALQQAEQQREQCHQRLTDAQREAAEADLRAQRLDQFTQGRWQAGQQAIINAAELSEQLKTLRQRKRELRQTQRQIQHALEQEYTRRGELAHAYDALNHQFNHSTFRTADAVEEGTAGINPELARQVVAEAEKALEAFQNSPETRQAKADLNTAEKQRAADYEALCETAGWQQFETLVTEKAGMAPAQRISQLRMVMDRIEGLEQTRREQQTVEQHQRELLEAAEAAKPDDRAVPGDLTELRQQRGALLRSLEELNQQLKHDSAQLAYMQADNQQQQAQHTDSAALITSIVSRIRQAAGGEPVSVEDLAARTETVNGLTSRFDEQNGRFKRLDSEARARWDDFSRVIDNELSRPLDEQKDPAMLSRLRTLDYTRAQAALDNTSLALKDCQDANRDDIEKIQRGWDATVIDLTMHLDRAISLLRAAARAKIPTGSPIHPGKAIFRMSESLSRLHQQDLSARCREALERWIRKGVVPASNGTNDQLTASLFQQLLPEGELNVRLIKTSHMERASYFPVSAPVGSDGQLLTSAFLLYMTIAQVRAVTANEPGYGFMVADNPIGECNADSLVRMQLQMARAVGVQLIYLTGHADLNAQAMFDKNIFMGRVAGQQGVRVVGRVQADDEPMPLWTAELEAPSLLAAPIPEAAEGVREE